MSFFGTLIRVPNASSWRRRASGINFSSPPANDITRHTKVECFPGRLQILQICITYFILILPVIALWEHCVLPFHEGGGSGVGGAFMITEVGGEWDGNPLSRRANWHLCKILHRHSSHSTNALNRLQIVTNAYLIDGWHSLPSGGRNELNWINVF